MPRRSNTSHNAAPVEDGTLAKDKEKSDGVNIEVSFDSHIILFNRLPIVIRSQISFPRLLPSFDCGWML